MNSTLRPHSLSTSSTLSSDTDCTENENIDVIGDNHKNDYNISGNNSVDYFSIDEDSIDRSLRGSPTRKRRLSSSGSHRSVSTEDIRELRSKINSRERKRMHDLNTAMDSLREIMPYAKGPSVRKLSKIATLSLAKNYIQMMSKTIEEMKQLLDDIYRSGGTHPAFNHGRIHPSPYLPSHHHSFTVMPPLSGTSHGPLHPVLHHTASHHPSPFTSHHHLSHQHHQNLLSTNGVNSLHPQNPSSQPVPASPPSSSSSADEQIATSLQTPHSVNVSSVCATPLFQATPCTCPGLGSYPISMLSTRPDSVVAYSLESNSKRSALL